MTTPAAENTVDRRCLSCGATNSTAAVKCWLCGVPLAGGEPAPSESAAKFPVEGKHTATGSGAIAPVPAHFQFGLASLMLTMTLISVCLGVISLSPGLGFGVIVLVTPAFLRTVIGARRMRRQGRPLGVPEKIMAFLGSLGLVTATAVAAGVAFYATCWVGFLGGMAVGEAAGAKGYDPLSWGLGTGVIVGAIAGIALGVFLIRRFWPVKWK